MSMIAGNGHGSQGLVQEVRMTSSESQDGYLDAPIIAGCVSALLLATAIIICLCVAITRKRLVQRNDSSRELKEKFQDNTYASIARTKNKQIRDGNLTPIKKSTCRSMASLSSKDGLGDSYEIYPYATFG